MKSKTTIAAAATILVVSAVSAMAQEATQVACMRNTVFAGGGVFNFTCKGDFLPDGVTLQNYCIPYAATNGNTPRGSAEAIAGWRETVNTHHSLTFTDAGASSPQVCAIAGSHYAQGIASDD